MKAMRYSDVMRYLAVPLNYRAHLACLMLEHMGYSFCVDYGCANAEQLISSKGLAGELL